MVEEAFANMPPAWERFARATLSRVHDRHVGISPYLVADLVPLLLEPNSKAQAGNPWKSVYERLQLSLADPKTHARGRSRHGLIFHANPSYCVMNLVIPLLMKVSEKLGFCYLFCDDEVPSGVDTDAYEQHARNLSIALVDLSLEKTTDYDLFWLERAMTLAHFSRPGDSGNSTPLPQADPTSLAMLLRLAPNIKETRKENTRFRQVASSQKRRRTHRLREGGVDGIQLTQRPEDLDGILLSEFTNPDFILTDRLLNTGFFSIQRNPRRDRMRDVLVVGLMPRDGTRELVRDFVKACWFECLMRLSLRLRQTGIQQSAFQWFEGDPLGRTRSCEFKLEDLPSLQGAPLARPTLRYRNEFMAALRWFPAFLDPTSGFHSHCSDPISGGPEQRLERMKEWAFQAWRERNTRGNPQQLYSHIHLMLFLPSDGDRSLSHNLTPLLRGFWPGSQAGCHASVCWLPKNLNEVGGWAFDARGQSRHHLFDENEKNVGEQELASCLITSWLEQLHKEIWRA